MKKVFTLKRGSFFAKGTCAMIKGMEPVVALLMGSDSDLPVFEQAEEVLKAFGVPYEMDVMSAHRSPERVSKYVQTARERGLKVIIAGAGMAAHLAGVAASYTTLPVIGIPISSGAMNGLDSLLSTVQMPPGVPVGTVTINGGKNAALFAIEILATSNSELAQKLDEFRKEQRASVEEKSARTKRRG